MIERLLPELLIQIIENLSPSEFFCLRMTSTYFAYLTRLHSRSLVPKISRRQYPLLHDMLKDDRIERIPEGYPEHLSDRVLKLAIAAMMANDTKLYPGCLLPVLIVDREGTPWKILYHFRTHKINSMDSTVESHQDEWDKAEKRAIWTEKYQTIYTRRSLKYLSFFNYLSRKVDVAMDAIKAVSAAYQVVQVPVGDEQLRRAILNTWRHDLDIYKDFHPRLFGNEEMDVDEDRYGTRTSYRDGPFLRTLSPQQRLDHALLANVVPGPRKSFSAPPL